MQIIKIQDEYFAVRANTTLSEADIKKYQNMPKPDITSATSGNYPDLDFAASRLLRDSLLQDKIPENAPLDNALQNNDDVKTAVLNQVRKDGLNYVWADYTIHNKEVPDGLKNKGLKLRRQIDFYRVKYDEQQQKYIITDLNDRETSIDGTRASVSLSRFELVLSDKIFGFNDEDIQIISRVYQQLSTQKSGQARAAAFNKLPPKEKALYAQYHYIHEHFQNIQQKHYSVAHELQHLSNKLKLTRRRLDPTAGKISTANHLRLLENDEKSAHLAEMLLAIKRFYTKNRDFHVFPQKCRWLVKELKRLPPAEVDKKLQDMHYIVNGVLREWNKSYGKSYRGKGGQFEQQLLDFAWKFPPFRAGNDETEYQAQRSLMFSQPVYNPQTGKSEIKDLSKFIEKDVELSSYLRQIADTAEKIIEKRRTQLEKRGITEDICRQMQLGTLPDTYTTTEPEPTPAPQRHPKKEPRQTEPQQPAPDKLVVDQNIAKPQPANQPETNQPETKPRPALPPKQKTEEKKQKEDFKTPYRKFYQDKAKSEHARYEEDEKSPHFSATLNRRNGEELTITATADNHASLSAKDAAKNAKIPDYQDFEDLVKCAAAQGKRISFGKIRTPEYKARLLLACLANNVEIKTIPNIDELKNLGPETRKRLLKYKSQMLHDKINDTSSSPEAASPAPNPAILSALNQRQASL